MGIALGVREAPDSDSAGFDVIFDRTCREIGATRPTAVNLFWAIDRMRHVREQSRGLDVPALKRRLEQEAVLMEVEDRELCKRIGQWGKEVIDQGDTVLTHCNAGGLATAGYGTALGVIRAAHDAGKKIRVFADETRPLNQGARLTCWELMKLGIPVTLIPDNTAGAMMQRSAIQKAVVGADRIASNGDTANKIGTFSVAVLCRYHNVPFYVAAPLSTVDMSLESGKDIPIEERSADEVTHIFGVPVAPDNVPATNIAFDVTPNELIAGIVTEWGIAAPPFKESLRALFDKRDGAAGI